MPMLRRIDYVPPPSVGKEALDQEPVRLPVNPNMGLVAGMLLAIGGIAAILSYYFELL